MFELKVLAINVLVPSIISVIALWLCRPRNAVANLGPSERKLALQPAPAVREASDSASATLVEPPFSTVYASLLSLTAVAAIWAAFGLRTEFVLWPQDAWKRLPQSVALVALGGILTQWIPNTFIRWTLRLVTLVGAAIVIFPTGEAWQELTKDRSAWIAAMSLSSFLGWLLISYQTPRRQAVVGFGWIFLFASCAFLTAQSFLKVTEPLLAVASVVGCVSIASCLSRNSQQLLPAVAGPCLFALSVAVASAQFNSYLGLSNWLSWLGMSSPAMAAAVSMLVPATQDGQVRLTRWHALATVITCLLLAGAIVGWTQVAAASGEEW